MAKASKKQHQGKIIKDQIESIRQRSKEGDDEATTDLGMYYQFGAKYPSGKWFLKPSLKKAIALYNVAVQKGNTAAMLNLANLLERGRGIRKNAEKAFQLQKRAARLNSGEAAYNVGVIYRDRGRFRLAVKWFHKAVGMGEHSALLELARAELLGRGTHRDVAAALRKIARVTRSAKVAVSDQEEACLLASRLYLEGWLLRRSLEKATQWLRRAGKTGSAEARVILDDLDAWIKTSEESI